MSLWALKPAGHRRPSVDVLLRDSRDSIVCQQEAICSGDCDCLELGNRIEDTTRTAPLRTLKVVGHGDKDEQAEYVCHGITALCSPPLEQIGHKVGFSQLPAT
eukprot:COSAG05_NODE_1061_length_5993_cov_166.021038_3_plen_103_part_00